MPKATHLECSLCHNRLNAGVVANLCTCGGPLLVRYDLEKIRHRWRRREVANGPPNMWRYAPLLPPANESIVTLGEGWTPLIRTERLSARIGAGDLWAKDEGLNPTASFKARGLACAISMCGSWDSEGGDSFRPRPWKVAPITPSVSIVLAVHNGVLLLRYPYCD